MNLRMMQRTDLSACAALAHRALAAEQSVHGALPAVDAGAFLPLLKELAEQNRAFVAEENGTVCGYLGFTPPFDGAFGNCRGVFSPLHASAFFGKDPSRTLTELLTASMDALYAKGVTSIAVCSYAHNAAVLRTLAMTGFGLRCSDLMRRTAPRCAACDGYTFRTAEPCDVPQLLSLYNALENHMAASPVFMPKASWTQERLLPRLHDILVACVHDRPIAALLLEPGGETFLDHQPGTMHVSSTFCHPDHRGSGAMQALVNFACDRMHRAGFSHLGVDCETINPPAFRFWSKHFAPFTFSAVRRLDERLVKV